MVHQTLAKRRVTGWAPKIDITQEMMNSYKEEEDEEEEEEDDQGKTKCCVLFSTMLLFMAHIFVLFIIHRVPLIIFYVTIRRIILF